MSSERYSQSRTFHEENRQGTGGYGTLYNQGVHVPIQSSSSNFNSNINEQRLQERLRHQDTTLQWVNDPISGKEKFRVNINIDGFNQNEVNIRVEGNKLLVYGEHIENQNQSSAKKIIEKSYELPRDLDTFSPQVTYPTPITMQVDFPSRHSNVIIDNGRTSTNLISSYDTTHRTPPRVSKETSSTEYTSTRKIGGDGGGSSSFIRSSSPRTYSPYDDLYGGTNLGRNNTYSSTNQYQTIGSQSPLRRDYTNSTTGSYNTSTNPTYTYRVTASDAQPRTIYPSSSSHGESGTVQEKTYSESRRETQHRRSSPTSGVQSSREFEHHRSGSPSLGRSLDDDHFRSNLSLGRPGMTTPASSRNVEVHEFSRRVGTNGNDTNNFIPREPLLFTQGFNSDAFYRSAFQPQVSSDNNGQKRIEMKLDVKNYQPNEVKVSVNGNDLIVQAEHNVDQPPTSSSRAYFYKQITLPPNTDISSLSSQYHPDGKLHITASLSPEQPYIRYN